MQRWIFTFHFEYTKFYCLTCDNGIKQNTYYSAETAEFKYDTSG